MTARTPLAPEARPLTQDVISRRCRAAIERIGAFIADRGSDRLRSRLPDWTARLHDILSRSVNKPEVAISLVGGTGAGKSTLLNALVGARVMPVSSMRSCTAAVCEVSYADGPYRARVEFVSRESWEKEVDLLRSDYRDARSVRDTDDAPDPREAMSRRVRDKLWTVYRPADGADGGSFDPLRLVEPDEVREVLDAGSVQVQDDDLAAFRKQIGSYLKSDSRFWPLVKSVTVQGPFTNLQDGAKIIDLPGVNDVNEAREEVTRTHLKTCRFVWLVFNTRRALTKDAFGLMQSDDFARQIVMDGRANALTFVGTSADDVRMDEDSIEELGLDGASDKLAVVDARNQAIRKVLAEQIDLLAERLCQLAGDQQSAAVRITQQLRSSRVFTVSASEYMRLIGLSKAAPAGFTNAEQTEMPALIEHLRHICRTYGVQAHNEALQRQLDLIFDEMDRELEVERAALSERARLGEHKRKEVQAATTIAREFLDRELDHARKHLNEALESAHKLLAERVRNATARGRRELHQRVATWGSMHHLTLRAICRRGGVYLDTHNVRHDFPSDLAKPVIEGIAFAWSDFFGEQLRTVLVRWMDHLKTVTDDFRRKLAVTAPPGSNGAAGRDTVFETSQQVLAELLAQTTRDMEVRITRDQRTLYDRVNGQIRAYMGRAFEEAGDEHGAGMKQRILGTLARHANQVSQVMFDDARDSLLDGVRDLNAWLKQEYEKMIAAVRRAGELAANNLVSSDEHISAKSIGLEQDRLSAFRAVLDECRSAA